MRLAIWDHPACGLLDAGLRQVKGLEVVRLEPGECAEALLTGEVDLALLTPLEILQQVDAFDVLPSIALSAWSYPFARLVLPGALGSHVPTVHVDPRYPLDKIVGRVVLSEHYGVQPAFVDCGVCDVEDLLSSGEGVLLSGPNAADFGSEPGQLNGWPESRTILDVGQEWTELNGYPMVLGFVAGPKGSLSQEVIRLAQSWGDTVEESRHEFAHQFADYWHDYFEHELRVRFDDVVTASLTEFTQFLMFYDVVDEIHELPVVYLEDEGEDDVAGDDSREPLL